MNKSSHSICTITLHLLVLVSNLISQVRQADGSCIKFHNYRSLNYRLIHPFIRHTVDTQTCTVDADCHDGIRFVAFFQIVFILKQIVSFTYFILNIYPLFVSVVA